MSNTTMKRIAALGIAGVIGAGVVLSASPAQATTDAHYTWGVVTGTVYFNTSTAALAIARGKCVKVKSTGVVGMYGGSQGDGYCR
jgi:hypothetical protein